MKVGFGEVVEVKKVRSLGVCRISVEVPLEAYKPAVALLDGERVLIVPSDLQQGFGIIEGSGDQSGFSGHVVKEQIEELPEYEDAGKIGTMTIVGAGVDDIHLAAEAFVSAGGIHYDEIDVPDSEDGLAHWIDKDGNEMEGLTGGKLAQHLDRVGAWRNPAIWRALNNTTILRSDYRRWIAEKPCVVSGFQSEDCQNAPHHWRKVETGGGTAIKPEDFWCIPLADKVHKALHQYGSESWLTGNGFTDDEMKAKAIGFMAEDNRRRFKLKAGIESMRELTPEMLEAFEVEFGVKI